MVDRDGGGGGAGAVPRRPELGVDSRHSDRGAHGCGLRHAVDGVLRAAQVRRWLRGDAAVRDDPAVPVRWGLLSDLAAAGMDAGGHQDPAAVARRRAGQRLHRRVTRLRRPPSRTSPCCARGSWLGRCCRTGSFDGGCTYDDAVPLRILPPMLRDVRRPQRMVERNVVAYRRQWIILLSGFFEPLFYLLSMRVGLGDLIGDCRGRRPARCRTTSSSRRG